MSRLTAEQKAALDALPPKRRAFVLDYVAHGNATQAARVAKYTHPEQQGHRLLKSVQVKVAIDAFRVQVDAVALSTREERLAFYAAVFRDTKVGMKERLKAAELAGKAGGDFIDRVAVSGDDERPAVKVVLSLDEAKRIARGGT